VTALSAHDFLFCASIEDRADEFRTKGLLHWFTALKLKNLENGTQQSQPGQAFGFY
jgi:hypothetical protein